MIRALIFDFDGVLVESVDVKTKAFCTIFAAYPEHLEAIKSYHLLHGGVSRVRKFQYIYEQLLKQPLSDRELDRLCAMFSDIVVEQVIAAPYVKGALDLLKQCRGHYQMFVASGTPEDEMREIVKRRELESYFDGVFGSPTRKDDIVRRILSEHHLRPDEVVFVGDAVTDLNAAKETHVAFIGREILDESQAWLEDSAVHAKFLDMTPVASFLQSLNHIHES